MEMPEGLEKLLEENHKIGSFNLKYSLKVFNAINLMKEMAEALEKVISNNPNQNPRYLANQILNKFKEWK